MTNITHSVESAVDTIIDRCGRDIKMFIPLGLGKPAQLTNALYRRAQSDPSVKLTIFTALTLERPAAAKGLQGAYLNPIFDRIFDGFVGVDYIRDVRSGKMPSNIKVHEFFVKSGGSINVANAQQNYISSNYTHAARDALEYGINLIAQVIAVDGDERKNVSLSCNPEITLCMTNQPTDRPMLVGQVHTHLPYMLNDAEVTADTFDLIIDDPELSTTLFGAPNMPVAMKDYMIGLYASSLVKDGSTLQIGIGALGDAVAYALEFRHEHNPAYVSTLNEMKLHERFEPTISKCGNDKIFEEGLYGSSEMFVDGFLYLMKAGILKKHVYQDLALQQWANEHPEVDRQSGPITLTPALFKQLIADGVVQQTLTEKETARLRNLGLLNANCHWQNDGISINDKHWPKPSFAQDDFLSEVCTQGLGDRIKSFCMHGGFFLGPRIFYQELRELSNEEKSIINMTDIRYMNHLYGDEELKRLQRQDARFINTAFMVSLLGAATSDALENGQAVSGVGGQYNFVAQAHELETARSILMLKATREKNGVVSSNIVPHYGHVTIPRHLRDIYITEYGIADVRGKSDSDVIKAMLNIADSRFQQELMESAKQAGKLEKGYQIPEIHRQNLPQKLESIWAHVNSHKEFPAFPFGSEFTQLEQELGGALKIMAAAKDSKLALLKLVLKGRKYKGTDAAPYLDRVCLTTPKNTTQKIERLALLGALDEFGLL